MTTEQRALDLKRLQLSLDCDRLIHIMTRWSTGEVIPTRDLPDEIWLDNLRALSKTLPRPSEQQTAKVQGLYELCSNMAPQERMARLNKRDPYSDKGIW
jgi:hypothetical protein